jgi:hypothetical protein
MASAIFVFLEGLDEVTGTCFVGAPEVTTLPLLLFTASMESNYQIASITAARSLTRAKPYRTRSTKGQILISQSIARNDMAGVGLPLRT